MNEKNKTRIKRRVDLEKEKKRSGKSKHKSNSEDKNYNRIEGEKKKTKLNERRCGQHRRTKVKIEMLPVELVIEGQKTRPAGHNRCRETTRAMERLSR